MISKAFVGWMNNQEKMESALASWVDKELSFQLSERVFSTKGTRKEWIYDEDDFWPPRKVKVTILIEEVE